MSRKATGRRYPIPVDDQQGEPDAEKPGMMLAFTPFLGQGFCVPRLRVVTPVTHNIEDTVLGGGRW